MSGELCYAYGSGALAFKRGDGRLIYKGEGKVTLVVDATFSPTSASLADGYILHGFSFKLARDEHDGDHVSTETVKDSKGYAYRMTITYRLNWGDAFSLTWQSLFMNAYQSEATVAVSFSLDGRASGGFSAASTDYDTTRNFAISADGKTIVSL